MRNNRCAFFILALSPVVAASLSGCGVGAALQNLSNPKFSDIALVTPSKAVALPVVQASIAPTGGATASSVPQAPAATISPAVEQTILSDLSGGRITSIEPMISLSLSGGSSRAVLLTGTHVGVVFSIQELSPSQCWAFLNGPAIQGGVQGGMMGGTLTFSQPGTYVFGPVDQHTPGVTYGGDLTNPASLNPGIEASGFDGLNAAALGSDFQGLITAASGAPINVYAVSYADPGAATGQIIINNLTISGQAHVSLF